MNNDIVNTLQSFLEEISLTKRRTVHHTPHYNDEAMAL